ncbi:MAG: Crp/Fnr family transcriptional regulator [Anaerolineae bacterium]|nr:Crp/Fnr family transcriptional regulator [Anaerolineae bacterium]
MADRDIDALRRIELFAGLDDAVLAHMTQAAVRRACEPGSIIVLEGAPCEAAYFVSAGQVRVYRVAPNGREQVLARLGPGQGFNTVPPFLPRGVNHATAEAIDRAVVYAIPASSLRQLVAQHPALALAMLRDFAARLDHLTNLVQDLSLRTVRGRLARFLLEQAEAGAVTRRWTQEEMAAQLGTVRDMVGRTVRAFVDAGLVRVERQRIVLVDQDGLQAEVDAS